MRFSAVLLAAAIMILALANCGSAADKKKKNVPETPINVAAAEIYFTADANKDDSLSKKEFEVAFKILEKKITDWAKDGTIKPLAVKTGEKLPPLPALPKADSDGDNKVSLDEFKAFATACAHRAEIQLRLAADIASTKTTPAGASTGTAAMRKP